MGAKTIAINTFTLLFSESKEKKSRRQISLMSMTDHAVGIAAELTWCYDIAHLIYEITERRAVTRQKGRKVLAPSGRLKNVFSGRQLGLVQEETLEVFCTRMPRETVRTTWDEVERRKKLSLGARILFSTESAHTD